MISSVTTPQTSKLRGVIFDMDGVLIDSHPVHRKAWQEFLQVLGKQISDSELDFILDGRKRRDILCHFLGDLSEQQFVEYGQRKNELFEHAALELKPIPGVVEFIHNLRSEGVALGVATSASASRTYSTLERLCLRKDFSAVVTGNDVREGKPNPAIYLTACREANVAPENSVAIEDAVSGIQAACGAGLRCVGVARGQAQSKLRAAGAGHVVEDFVGLSTACLEALLEE